MAGGMSFRLYITPTMTDYTHIHMCVNVFVVMW